MTTLSSSRDGRLLVECLIATVLLSATALIVISLTQSIARAEQTAQRTTLAWQLTLQHDAVARSQSCDSNTVTSREAQRGVVTSWSITPHVHYTEFHSQIVLTYSALVNRRPSALSWRDAWNCP